MPTLHRAIRLFLLFPCNLSLLDAGVLLRSGDLVVFLRITRAIRDYNREFRFSRLRLDRLHHLLQLLLTPHDLRFPVHDVLFHRADVFIECTT